MGLLDEAVLGRSIGAAAVGDTGCLTLTSSVGSTTYCATLDQIALSGGEGEVIVELEPRSSDAAVADILVNINIAGQTQLSTFATWPAPGDAPTTLRASGPADPGDPVSFLATTSKFDGGQIVIEGELPTTISIDDVSVTGCATPSNISPGETISFTAFVENTNPDVDAVADIGWFVNGQLLAKESSLIVDAGSTEFVASPGGLTWEDLEEAVGVGTFDVDAEVLFVF